MNRWLSSLLGIALISGCAWLPGPKPVPGPELDHHLRVCVQSADEQAPLLTASIKRNEDLPIHVGGDGCAAWQILAAGFDVCASASGYASQCTQITQFINQAVVIELARLPAPTPAPDPTPTPDIAPISYPPAARAPIERLPPIGPDPGDGFWSFDPYALGLAFDPPDLPSPAYVRGNFGPMDFPSCDLPRVSGDYPTMSMSWSLPQYTPDRQVCVLQTHQQAGYTHIGTYWPFSRNQGVSDDAFEDTLQRVKRAWLWNVVTLYGGDGEDWAHDILPRLERWWASGAISSGDILVTCWQCNGKYDPYPLAEITIQVASWAHARGLLVAQHWYSGTIAWWDADDSPRSPSTCHATDAARLGLTPFCNRFEYGQAFADLIDFQFQQFDPYAPLADDRPRQGGTRGELCNSIAAIYGRTKLVVSEYDAQRREDINAPEIEGDAKGFTLLSVTCGATGGFFNGARMLDGSWVH